VSRRLPIYLLIDTSGSMRNEPVEAVNNGLKKLMAALRQNPYALETAWVSVITFDDDAKQVVPLTEVAQFQPPPLKVDRGLTSLGKGLELVAACIDREVQKSTAENRGDWRPIVFILTDGEPTDDWQKGIEKFLRAKAGLVIACAAGLDCDTFILKKITENVVELDKVDAATVTAYFKWVSDSVMTTSQSIGTAGRELKALKDLPALPTEVKEAINLRKGSGADGIDPYTPYKGVNAIRAANKDRYGNAEGSEYDLVRDGAFNGLRIAVLNLCAEVNFSQATAALEEKGFSVCLWASTPPPLNEFEKQLARACQLWLISDRNERLTNDHVYLIRNFFESGRGIYIWGDNDPYYIDANKVAACLLKTQMYGDVPGDHVVRIQSKQGSPGLAANHPITTGLECLYEGITIATVKGPERLTPVVVGSAGNLVVAAYDADGKRAVIDGGFTRLFYKWDTAGTGRYVKNAAAWLTNYERFGKTLFTQQRL
jgi:uncharacterized protein YegL